MFSRLIFESRRQPVSLLVLIILFFWFRVVLLLLFLARLAGWQAACLPMPVFAFVLFVFPFVWFTYLSPCYVLSIWVLPAILALSGSKAACVPS